MKDKAYLIYLEKIRKERSIKELINFSILNLDKPAGCTSFDVVDSVRRMFSEFGVKKCGHLGTLDPNVTGVLPICVGNACKIQDYFMHHEKTYIGKMKLHRDITKEQLEVEMRKFIGKINQLPPRISRVKRVVREREIAEFKLLNLDEKKREAEFIARVQAGTYIRKLIDDLGKNIGGAQMIELRRTQAGLFSHEDREFTKLEDIDRALKEYKSGREEKLRRLLIPAEIIIRILPIVETKSEFIDKLKHGSPIFEEMLLDVKNSKKIIESKEPFAIILDNNLIEIAQFDEKMSKEFPNILAKPQTVLIQD